jgi:NADH:ubiquinone oxidoreductase subunit F (NADH-binding)
VSLVHRLDFPTPIPSLEEYVRHRGGRGLEVANGLEPDAIIELIADSGLRGRGGAGFPTGRKWRSVADLHSDELPTSVVVNAAEGEPGTFKDRHLLMIDPYQVIEGALIAARAVRAKDVIVAVKEINTDHVDRLRAAIDEVVAAGWAGEVSIGLAFGPDEYLFGEETALLEVVDGRLPFPRIAAPYRRGVSEVVLSDVDARSGSGLSAHVVMAGTGGAPPALVDNVETLANVAHITARGSAWFRTMGTDQSPGTFVCTVTGDVDHSGVGEVQCGTSLADVIELVGGGVRPGSTVKAVLSGVANRVITAGELDVAVAYETMQPLGIGPGSGGFVIYDDSTDMVAVAAGVARFLAVESCGQCTPCKVDGLELANRLEALCHNEATEKDWQQIRRRLGTVADGARCALASQHQSAVASILDVFADEVTAHLERRAPRIEPRPISELRDVSNGVAAWDERHASKQPDWSYEVSWSGKAPAERYGDHRRPERPAE